jgi:fumarate hydratase, class II
MASSLKHHSKDVPIGTGETGTRTETDSMGKIEVPADH